MTDDRWHRVTEIFHAAARLADGERAAYLRDACGDDASLQAEVEALLAADSEAGAFGAAPLVAERSAVQPLPAGTRLGPHEILGLLGAGGMGEVYEARDTRLDRVVAVKILPAALGRDPARRARFVREAKTIAQLSHPHICTLYDVGEAPVSEPDGAAAGPARQYLVMERLEGETLAARLARSGRLPVAEALRIGAEVADALAAAHRHGVIHRDLKPANVMLTKSGAKLLDFGLAKLRAHGERPAVETTAREASESDALTGRGVRLGTLPYMAPEQVEGKPADARTDLWALGALLYEMLTGQRAFAGESEPSLIAAILDQDPPPLGERAPLTPRALGRLVRKCLAKAPDERRESAHDVADELRWMAQARATDEQAAAGVSRSPRRLAFGVLALVLVAVATVVVTWFVVRESPVPAPPAVAQKWLIDTRPADGLRGPNRDEEDPSSGLNRPSRTAIALSPDGTLLVFSALWGERQQLFLRRWTEDEAVPIDGTEGADNPFFSPDGTWLGFWAKDALWKLRLDGGRPIWLCETDPIAGASWSTRDVIAFGVVQEGPVLHTVRATDGVVDVVTLDAESTGAAYLPFFLPDGDTLLFSLKVGHIPGASVGAISLRTRVQTRILEDALDARYIPATGHLVYVRRGRLEAVPFDADRLVVAGQAVTVVDHVMQAVNSGSGFIETGAGQYAFSDTGTLVYVEGGITPDPSHLLEWVDRRGNPIETLPLAPGPYYQPQLSADAQQILYLRRGLNPSLHVYDTVRKVPTMIPVSVPDPGFAVWSPDETRVAFGTPAAGKARLYTVPVDGSAPPTPVGGNVPAGVADHPASWTPDGETLLYVRTPSYSIWRVRPFAVQPERSPVLEHGYGWPALSPDGRWLAYTRDGAEEHEVYIQRFPELGGQRKVSRAEGRAPVWRRDGREIFFLSGSSTEGVRWAMTVVSVPPGDEPTLGAPQILFEMPRADHYTGTWFVAPYAVSPDGQRFLLVRRVARPLPPPPSEIHVVLNWFEELKAMVPSGR